MGEAVIFTPEVAEALMAQGFKLVARTDKAYYFEDSVLLWCATNKLLMELARKGLQVACRLLEKFDNSKNFRYNIIAQYNKRKMWL